MTLWVILSFMTSAAVGQFQLAQQLWFSAYIYAAWLSDFWLKKLARFFAVIFDTMTHVEPFNPNAVGKLLQAKLADGHRLPNAIVLHLSNVLTDLRKICHDDHIGPMHFASCAATSKIDARKKVVKHIWCSAWYCLLSHALECRKLCGVNASHSAVTPTSHKSNGINDHDTSLHDVKKRRNGMVSNHSIKQSKFIFQVITEKIQCNKCCST